MYVETVDQSESSLIINSGQRLSLKSINSINVSVADFAKLAVDIPFVFGSTSRSRRLHRQNARRRLPFPAVFDVK